MWPAVFAAGTTLGAVLLRLRSQARGTPREGEPKARRRAPYVVISDPTAFYRKRAAFMRAGAGDLVVVSDFDFTCSKFWTEEGTRGASTHKVLEDCGLFSERYHKEAKALQQYYYPLEVSPSLSHEEKYRHMVAWFTKAHDLLVATGLRKSQIAQAVRDSVVDLRSGVTTFLRKLEAADVPTLIFSAGLADVLEEVLRQHAYTPPNVHIAANKMRFDRHGVLAGFEDPCFHVFNKEASAVRGEPYFADIRRRRHVLLLGDNLGDLKMSHGLDATEVLSVGFLNDRVESRLSTYMRSFDMVVVHDGDFEAVNALLDDVIGCEAPCEAN